MHLTLAQKILQQHLMGVKELPEPGKTIAIRIDQTLTQDATGTMAYLQFEALGIPKVKTELSVSYVDHNMLQSGFENPDDHVFLQTFAKKYGIYFSKPGNGICHQVHLERFGVPGKTLLGSDSHTPTGGGIGMIAMGAGGLDIALAMGGGAFHLPMPKIVNVELTGKLQPFVSAKDIILEVLRLLTVKGGVGKIMEYTGPGVKTLSVPERATITNMGAELGATTSVFPSDEQTREFLRAQCREFCWAPLAADEGAVYHEKISINLSELEPLIAQPHMPDKVVKVRDLKGTKVQQVAMGSCTNSSYRDLMIVAGMLQGRKLHEDVSAGLAPGSRQIIEELLDNGAWMDIVSSGVRILESGCGPCIGMGYSPPSAGVSIRTNNRNFIGRSGTKDASVFLASPETAVACALTGEITDPRDLEIEPFDIETPETFIIDDSLILAPSPEPEKVEIIRGPNIQPLPVKGRLPEIIEGEVLIKLEDNITTDHIMPAGAKILPLRSNIPKISEHVFEVVDTGFPARAKAKGGGFIVGGANYGQGSSREHAALAPMYLGVKAVLVKSFARIHLANLINFGILPLTFVDEADYARIEAGDKLSFNTNDIAAGAEFTIKNVTKKSEFKATHPLDGRSIEIIKAGGALAFAKESSK